MNCIFTICIMYSLLDKVMNDAKPATKGLTTYKRRIGIDKTHSPEMIFFGDSHITRLYYWSSNKLAKGGPNDLEQKIMGNSRFIYSGGSKWFNVMDRVTAEKVPAHQKQGNLWQIVADEVASGEFVPEHFIISLLSNDLDALNDRYFDTLSRSTIWHTLSYFNCGPSLFYRKMNNQWFNDQLRPPVRPFEMDHEKYINNQFDKICQQIDQVMWTVKQFFPGCQFYVLSAIPRDNWYPAIVKLIPRFNRYMRQKHKVKVLAVNGFLMEKHLDDYRVHFSNEGYKLLLSKGLGPIVDAHIKKYGPEKAPKRKLEDMSKTQRRRIYAKIRRANAAKGIFAK